MVTLLAFPVLALTVGISTAVLVKPVKQVVLVVVGTVEFAPEIVRISEATEKLKDFKIEYSGNGNRVGYQSPKAQERIYEGETVRLMLSK